jgi:hypothetical protein
VHPSISTSGRTSLPPPHGGLIRPATRRVGLSRTCLPPRRVGLGCARLPPFCPVGLGRTHPRRRRRRVGLGRTSPPPPPSPSLSWPYASSLSPTLRHRILRVVVGSHISSSGHTHRWWGPTRRLGGESVDDWLHRPRILLATIDFETPLLGSTRR